MFDAIDARESTERTGVTDEGDGDGVAGMRRIAECLN